MSKLFFATTSWILVLLFSVTALAGLETYSALQMRNLDEMRTEVRDRLEEARKYVEEDDNDAATAALYRASLLIFSRPDGDNMVATLFQDVRPRLVDLEAYESTVAKLAEQAMAKLKDDKAKPAHRATQLVLLENLLAEFKPEIQRNKKIKAVFVKIRDAKIKVPEAANNDFRMKGLNPRRSPSEIAQEIIGKEQ